MAAKNKGEYKFKFSDWLLIGLTVLFSIIFFYISIPFYIADVTRFKREYYFLKAAEFKSKTNRLLGTYNWIKHNICISIFHDYRNQIFDYKMSINYDTNAPVFKSLYDWQIGTEQELDRLKISIGSYANASSLELQKEQPNREVEILHRDFIRLYLNEILDFEVIVSSDCAKKERGN